jgi:hypothetical protein
MSEPTRAPALPFRPFDGNGIAMIEPAPMRRALRAAFGTSVAVAVAVSAHR